MDKRSDLAIRWIEKNRPILDSKNHGKITLHLKPDGLRVENGTFDELDFDGRGAILPIVNK